MIGLDSEEPYLVSTLSLLLASIPEGVVCSGVVAATASGSDLLALAAAEAAALAAAAAEPCFKSCLVAGLSCFCFCSALLLRLLFEPTLLLSPFASWSCLFRLPGVLKVMPTLSFSGFLALLLFWALFLVSDFLWLALTSELRLLFFGAGVFFEAGEGSSLAFLLEPALDFSVALPPFSLALGVLSAGAGLEAFSVEPLLNFSGCCCALADFSVLLVDFSTVDGFCFSADLLSLSADLGAALSADLTALSDLVVVLLFDGRSGYYV